MWLLSTWNMASVTVEWNFKFYLLLINWHACMWLMTTVLDNAGLGWHANYLAWPTGPFMLSLCSLLILIFYSLPLHTLSPNRTACFFSSCTHYILLGFFFFSPSWNPLSCLICLTKFLLSSHDSVEIAFSSVRPSQIPSGEFTFLCWASTRATVQARGHHLHRSPCAGYFGLCNAQYMWPSWVKVQTLKKKYMLIFWHNTFTQFTQFIHSFVRLFIYSFMRHWTWLA